MSFARLYEGQGHISSDTLLAHYSSIENIINIVKSEQIWMSHPLFMNDWHELDAGINAVGSALLEVTGNPRMLFEYRMAVDGFKALYKLDTYVCCFIKHESNVDGKLSMWRGYGDNGRGACIVFNNEFRGETTDESILFLCRVQYKSNIDRYNIAKDIVQTWIDCKNDPNIDNKYRGREYDYLLDRAIIYALTTKHEGFSEEDEIRLIYLKFRDHRGILSKYYDYHIGSRGVEVKLKLPLNPRPEDPHKDWSFQKIVDSVIIGPASSSDLAKGCLCRAFEKIGKQWLVERVHTSGIPFRPHP